MTNPLQEGALAGLKVLDLSRVLAGPWCTQILADLGADVVKIERPGVGDDTRTWGPPFLKDSDGQDTDQATYFTSCNRNKRSVTIDMATPEGRDLLQQMAAQSDVVVENFKTGGLKQYGLDHESLRAANPRLIYCSITGFGHDGPNTLRVKHRETLIPQLDAVTRTRTTAEWIAMLEDKAVPCGPINNVAQAFEDPQVKARGLAVTLPRQAGDGIAHITGVASPLRLSATPPVLRNAAPALGQHTDEVLAELGFTASRIAELRSAQVIQFQQPPDGD
jgi:crotonobetainyl-CoA:carnitine CoA-transferase CaiB-like acyl-CoA transferase